MFNRLGFSSRIKQQHSSANLSIPPLRYFHSTSLFLEPNPFQGKTFTEIDELLLSHGFIKKGPDPAAGRGSYFHPDSGRKYYLDKGGYQLKGIVELAHVDVHRMEEGVNLEKRFKHRYPLGDKLYEKRNAGSSNRSRTSPGS